MTDASERTSSPEQFDSVDLIKQGAEARIYMCIRNGCRLIKKERFAKSYRHRELDHRLNKKRHQNELKCLRRAQVLRIPVPGVIKSGDLWFQMEYISDSETAAAFLDKSTATMANRLCFRLGEIVAQLHSNNIVHGDLTTSNFLVKNVDPEDVYVIDFGLATVTDSIEQFGVDLYVLERALILNQKQTKDLFKYFVDGYESGWGDNSRRAKRILIKLDQVRSRGRKRSMVG
ncbi:hypothetical protein ACOME3_001960 [Neoechinorhynchus agilis]